MIYSSFVIDYAYNYLSDSLGPMYCNKSNMSLTIVNYMQIFWSDLAYFVFVIHWLECMPDVRH